MPKKYIRKTDRDYIKKSADQPISIKQSIDEDGIEIVLVPLHKSTDHAILYLSDYNWFIDNGISMNWTYGQSRMWQVTCYNPKTKMRQSVARIITNGTRGQRVKFINGDSKDLRRSNLLLMNIVKTKGSAKKKIKSDKPHKQQNIKTIKESNDNLSLRT